MAQKIETILEDDLDGGEATQTVHFGVDGKSFEIDLNDSNAAELRELLNDYIIAARLDSAGTARKAPQHRSDPAVVKAIRSWARSNGMEIKDRGRIPSGVVEAYHAAA